MRLTAVLLWLGNLEAEAAAHFIVKIVTLKMHTKVKLKKDIISFGKNKTLYGLKDQVLPIITNKGNVLIVKGKKENFPVNVEDVILI